MNPLRRLARHARLTSYAYRDAASPPFLVLFINSICNMKCEHCFYWTSLNKKDDLTRDELFALSNSLGWKRCSKMFKGKVWLSPVPLDPSERTAIGATDGLPK
jgi:hypothetical protein